MTALDAFLLDRLREAEAAARAATPGPWRYNPNKHHPHRWRCADPVDCGGWDYPCDYDPLDCCVCGQEWPCDERQKRDAQKARSPS
jgi:hypothetical protein